MITTNHEPQSGPFPRLLSHVPSQAIVALNAVRGWQTRRRTERALEGMPFDLRKDIGWPASQTAATGTAVRPAA
ncbi:MAG: hypothetical protein ACOH2J_07490 [Allorhizobium sp.]